MPTPRFYLKKPEANGQSLIYLQLKYNGKKFVYSFGETIRPADWDADLQQPKEKKTTTTNGQYLLADTLAALTKQCNNLYRSHLPNGIPTPAMLKAGLDEWMQQHFHREAREKQAREEAKQAEAARVTLMQLIDRFISGQIKYKGRNKSSNTLKTYATCKMHLQGFEAYSKQPVDFDSITLDFYYRWVDYLKMSNKTKKGLKDNAVGKMVQILKVFMSEGVDLGYTDNVAFQHKKFAVNRTDSDAVYLSEAEILHLYNFDLSDKPNLMEARDLFVFGCWVGLRYSDYSNVKPENIIDIDGDKFIRIKTKKTGDVVYIPCNPVVMDIFKKYASRANKLPKSYAEPVFNRYIKEAAKLAGIDEKGRLISDPDAELWQCISSHTARRSFATNYYLESFPTIDLMKITGHSTEKSFLRYVKVSQMDAAKRMAEHNKRKNWPVIMGRIYQNTMKAV